MTTTGQWARGLIDLQPAEHPAKFSAPILLTLDAVVTAEAEYQGRRLRIFDNTAGTCRAERFAAAGHFVACNELEPEWVLHGSGPRTVGDARRLPYRRSSMDVLVDSPCLAQEHRLLTADLRWVAAGDLGVGDEVLAFDDQGAVGTGVTSRRRWRRATVTRAEPKRVECVRVILEDGEELITTPEHPWLTSRYVCGGTGTEWVASRDLLGGRGRGDTRGHRRGERQPRFVHRQMEPWRQRGTFDAGWLSGLFDGEGSLSLGFHGSPKLVVSQAEGAVIDRAERLMTEYGYDPYRLSKGQPIGNRQKVENLYVRGGFPTLLRALGELRPIRLLEKWDRLDVSTRTISSTRVAVVAVEPAGQRDIQEVETTEGTYFGEGYLMHNCYGNRMADHHEAKDPCSACKGVALDPVCKKCKGTGLSPRMSYRHKLGRMPSAGSTTVLPWGAAYRRLHQAFMVEALEVLRGGGLVVWNTSNHPKTMDTPWGREEVTQRVNEWYLSEWMVLGCNVIQVERVSTSRFRNGRNRETRDDGELVMVLRAPQKREGMLL